MTCARRHGIVCIADEVLLGFGRTGAWFGVDHEGVAPDLVVFAKGVNSGYEPSAGSRECIAPGERQRLRRYGDEKVVSAPGDRALPLLGSSSQAADVLHLSR